MYTTYKSQIDFEIQKVGLTDQFVGEIAQKIFDNTKQLSSASFLSSYIPFIKTLGEFGGIKMSDGLGVASIAIVRFIELRELQLRGLRKDKSDLLTSFADTAFESIDGIRNSKKDWVRVSNASFRT